MLTLLTVQFVAEVPISFVSPVLCSETSLSREGMNNKSDPTSYKLLWHCRLYHAPDSLQYQRLTWEHFIKISLHFNSSPLHRKQSLYIPKLSTEKLSDPSWQSEWLWTGWPLLLSYKPPPNLLDLLIFPNRWIISMKKLWDFTRDFGQKEVNNW